MSEGKTNIGHWFGNPEEERKTQKPKVRARFTEDIPSF